MKNIFLTLAFVFVTTFSFAGSNATVAGKCTHVTLSCGVQYDICNFQGTTTQLVNSVINSNNNVCGTSIGFIR